MRGARRIAAACALAATRGIAAAVVLAAAPACSETGTAAPPSVEIDAAAPDTEAPHQSRWSFGASVYTYVVPDDRDYAQPTLTADRDWLHLEARYDYEAMRTGSLWVGYNLAGGDALSWELTPLLGGVVGDIWGIAPGFKGSVAWWKLELSSEGECVFDTSDFSVSFLYSWSELALAPVDWIRFGLAGQRTRAYKSDRDVQRGVFVGLSYRHLALTTYVFDPDTREPTVVVAVGASY